LKHAQWFDFLQQFSFVLKHKVGVENRVADALSRKSFLLAKLTVLVVGFNDVKQHYKNDADFGVIHQTLSHCKPNSVKDYQLANGFSLLWHMSLSTKHIHSGTHSEGISCGWISGPIWARENHCLAL
jgi:hypothetical protein